jgi:dCMP deaminase
MRDDAFYLTRAAHIARRSTCDRAAVGCVIAHPVLGELGYGYNSAPKGSPTCADEGHLMHDGHCCRATHAEINALANCARHSAFSPECATAYVTHYPCISCAHALIAHGIVRIVYGEPYRVNEVTAFVLASAGVEVVNGRE